MRRLMTSIAFSTVAFAATACSMSGAATLADGRATTHDAVSSMHDAGHDAKGLTDSASAADGANAQTDASSSAQDAATTADALPTTRDATATTIDAPIDDASSLDAKPTNSDAAIVASPDAPQPDAAIIASPDAAQPDAAIVVPPDAAQPDAAIVVPPDAALPRTVITVAGNGTSAYADGTGGATGTAEFRNPVGVDVDSDGNIYVGDVQNNRVRKIDSSGNVTTLAGNGTGAFVDGTGGPAGTAEFSGPSGVAVDAAGNVYVADYFNHRVRKIDTKGNVTTVAGNGTNGSADGTGGAHGTAEFRNPDGLAIDSSGNLYVADTGDNRVRKIDTIGNVTTLAGNGTDGFSDGTGGANGTAEFGECTAVAVDSAGIVYVADFDNSRIRKIDIHGNVTTLAGNGTGGFFDGTGGANGTAEFFHADGLGVDSHGNVYVADNLNQRIRKIDPSGNVTTYAGSGTTGFADGTDSNAEFQYPGGIAVDSAGNVYVADTYNNRIREIIP